MTKATSPFHPIRSTQRGAASVVALFMVLVLGGLSFGLLEEGLAARGSQRRDEGTTRALEIAEAGLVRAELEILATHDWGADGVGNVSGAFGGGTFSVTSTSLGGNLYLVRSKGVHGLSTRALEEQVRRNPGSPFLYAAFGRDGVTVSSSPTDAYDSRLGTYASQATHADAKGVYAQSGGAVGSNNAITLSGSTWIRGDARAGPGYTTSGASLASGDTTAMTLPVDLPYTPIADFQSAMASAQNGTWTGVGGSLTYDPVKRALTMSGGGTLVLSAGTYFLTNLTISGGSTLKITGPVKLYTTGKADISGGSIFNSSGLPADFQIFSHPYTTLVPGYTPGTTSLTVSGGGTGAAFVSYGPESPLTFSGGGNIYGSYIAKTVTNSGGSFLHYDKALGDLGGGMSSITHIYWREAAPPRR